MAIQSTLYPNPCKILCLGDSQTLAFTNRVFPTEYYPAQVRSQALTGVTVNGITNKYNLDCINCGNSGWTTAQLNDIVADRIQRFQPSVFVYYAGVNDTGGSLVPASIICSGTTATVTLAINTMPYNEGQPLTVTNANQGAVNVANQAIHITGANTFTYTMGGSFTGTATPTTNNLLTVTSPFTGAKTQGYIQTAIDVAIANGVQYVAVMNTNYLNYSSGGDNFGASTFYGTYQALRTSQYAAAVTYGVATYPGKVGYCDLWTGQKNLVVANAAGWTQGSFGSHVADTNQHMNALGHSATGTILLNFLTGVSGLLDNYIIQTRG